MTTITCSVSIDLNAPIQRVWSALTDPAQIKKYLFGTDTHTDWRVGSPIRFTGEWEGKPYEDKGVVMAIEEPTLLQYNYFSNFAGQPDVPENYQLITYHLTEANGQTRFTLTQENCPTEAAKEHSASNWSMVLNSLKELVEN